MAEPPELLPSIRRFAADGAVDRPPHIPHHRERDGLALILELLRGPERDLHVAALRTISYAAIVEPDSVPAGLVEEVCRLACEARTCEAATGAYRRLEVRRAVMPAHHEGVLAADERRLAMILDGLRAGLPSHSVLHAQLLRVRNPRLPPLFTTDLLALSPVAMSDVLVLFDEVYTTARTYHDKELKRTILREGESGFDPAFVRALLSLVGDDRFEPDWCLSTVALLQRCGEDISSAMPALWKIAVDDDVQDAARLVLPGLLERRAWADMALLIEGCPHAARDVTVGLARLVSGGDTLAGAAELIDRLGRPDDLVFALWRHQNDVAAIADHLMSDEVRSGARKRMRLAPPLLGDVVALLAERAARRGADATTALAALADLATHQADIGRAAAIAAELRAVPELRAHALAVLARMPTPDPALLPEFAAVLAPDCPPSIACHVLDGVRRAIHALWDRPSDPGLVAILPPLRALARHVDEPVRHGAVVCLCSDKRQLGPADVEVLVEVLATPTGAEASAPWAIPTLCDLAERGLDVSAAEPHLPGHIQRSYDDGVHPALLLAHILLRRGRRFPETFWTKLSSSRSAPWGDNEAAYPVLEGLVAVDRRLAAWLLATLEAEREALAIDGHHPGAEDDKLRAACAVALASGEPGPSATP